MTGRPTKLTPETHDLIVGLLQAGHYKETAAEAAGIDRTTLYNWLRWGEAEDATTPTINPDDHTAAELRQIAADRNVPLTGLRRKADIADALNQAGHGSPYLHFFHAVREATARAELYAVSEMVRVGGDDWRMWMEYLARTRPDRWGRKDRLEDEADNWGGTTEDAQRQLDRAREIVVKTRQIAAGE